MQPQTIITPDLKTWDRHKSNCSILVQKKHNKYKFHIGTYVGDFLFYLLIHQVIRDICILPILTSLRQYVYKYCSKVWNQISHFVIFFKKKL